MDYLGTKTKLLGWLFKHIGRHQEEAGLKGPVFLDACTGTGAVAAYATTLGYSHVIANDALNYPYHIVRGKTCLSPEGLRRCREHIAELNRLDPIEVFFSREFSESAGRPFFTDRNAGLIDAARHYVQGVGDPDEQSYLWYCLLEALSRRANTAGTHGAFMKYMQPEAKKDLVVREEPTKYAGGRLEAHARDILELLGDSEFRERVKEDVLYIDPPYNPRQYATYFHLYSALVAPSDPEIAGISGRPVEHYRSPFCGTTERVTDFLRDILKKTRADIVAVSYSSDSTVPFDEMVQALVSGFGHEAVEVQVKVYDRYRSAEKGSSHQLKTSTLLEYLFIIRRERDAIAELFGA